MSYLNVVHYESIVRGLETTVQMSSEENLIERVRRKFPSLAGSLPAGAGHAGVLVGMGDDAAVLRPRAGKDLVVTTDAFLENVHFLRNVHPPTAVGYNSLARAT